MANTNIFWVLHRDEERTISLSNSLVIGYNELVNKGGGAGGLGEKGNPDKLKFGKDVIIKKEGTVQIEEDPTKRNYLHLVPGTQGADLRAGLFTK